MVEVKQPSPKAKHGTKNLILQWTVFMELSTQNNEIFQQRQSFQTKPEKFIFE